jgi:hypothetical protein
MGPDPRAILRQMESSGDQEITVKQESGVQTLMQSKPEAL